MPANELEMKKQKRLHPELFTKDFDNQSLGEILKKKEDKGYYSVEEAATTDTHEPEAKTLVQEKQEQGEQSSLLDSMMKEEVKHNVKFEQESVKINKVSNLADFEQDFKYSEKDIENFKTNIEEISNLRLGSATMGLYQQTR